MENELTSMFKCAECGSVSIRVVSSVHDKTRLFCSLACKDKFIGKGAGDDTLPEVRSLIGYKTKDGIIIVRGEV